MALQFIPLAAGKLATAGSAAWSGIKSAGVMKTLMAGGTAATMLPMAKNWIGDRFTDVKEMLDGTRRAEKKQAEEDEKARASGQLTKSEKAEIEREQKKAKEMEGLPLSQQLAIRERELKGETPKFFENPVGNVVGTIRSVFVGVCADVAGLLPGKSGNLVKDAEAATKLEGPDRDKALHQINKKAQDYLNEGDLSPEDKKRFETAFDSGFDGKPLKMPEGVDEKMQEALKFAHGSGSEVRENFGEAFAREGKLRETPKKEAAKELADEHEQKKAGQQSKDAGQGPSKADIITKSLNDVGSRTLNIGADTKGAPKAEKEGPKEKPQEKAAQAEGPELG